MSELSAYQYPDDPPDSLDAFRASLSWEIPETFNMATSICDRWAGDSDRTALYVDSNDDAPSALAFWQLRDAANRLANYFEANEIGRGDRVLLHGSQRPETLVTFLAAWKVGAAAVPVSKLLGSAELQYRLKDSGAVAFVADGSGAADHRDVDPIPSTLETTVTVDGDDNRGTTAFWTTVSGYDSARSTAETAPTDPACVIYTSGTTGPPKGAVLPHQVLLGHLPYFLTGGTNLELREDDVFWTPSEWTWIGTLYTRLFPPLYYGRPVLASARRKFDPEHAFELIEEYDVTALGTAPTVLRMMMRVEDPDRFEVDSLRLVGAGGEPLGERLREWVRETFDAVAVHEGYGQTEANAITVECEALFSHRDGTLGKPAPGREVEIVDPDTALPTVAPGEVGEIALRYEDDPVTFLHYENRPAETEAKRANGFHLTGDLGSMDADGYVTFVGRKDHVIVSSGYRIGPQEIEAHLTDHPAVDDAGVIGVPHETRGEVPKAFLVLGSGHEGSRELREDLTQYVKDRLATYKYPREVAFVSELPRTETGKLRRGVLREGPTED